MEQARPDRLIPLNASYLEEFQTRLAVFNPILRQISVERLIDTLRDQFDAQFFEIISRRLLGQMVPDIAEQMRLDELYVRKVLIDAPRELCAPEITIDEPVEELPEAFEVPMKDGKVSAHTVAKLTNQKQSWVQKQLRASSLEATPDIYNGMDILRYDEAEAVAYIKSILAERPKPGGDMMTIYRMAHELGKEYAWVATRVEDRFEAFGEMRLDDRIRESIHYPRWVFRTLKAELEKLKKYPTATESDYAIVDLARILHRDQKWIELRLLPLKIYGRTKISPYNKVPRVYYDDHDLRLLSEENEKSLSYPVADEHDATADELGRIVKHDLKWVRRRLPYIAVFPRTKMNPKNNQPNAYFSKEEAAAALSALPADILKTEPPIFDIQPEPQELPVLVEPRMPNINVRKPLDFRVIPISDVQARKAGRVVRRAIQITGHPTSQNLIKPIDSKPDEENWREFGECLQYFPEMFFPEKGESTKDAKEACGKCAVTAFCLQYALDTNQKSGIFGGLSERERRRLQKVKAAN
ncbi:MAG: WhiB family transcriptional regulator [Candidatus Microsaccharimonas sp.]